MSQFNILGHRWTQFVNFPSPEMLSLEMTIKRIYLNHERMTLGNSDQCVPRSLWDNAIMRMRGRTIMKDVVAYLSKRTL